MRPLVYVAGPVTNPKDAHWENMHAACEVAEQVVDAGAVPLIPQLSIAWVSSMVRRDPDSAVCRCGKKGSECDHIDPSPVLGKFGYEQWIDMCFEQIRRCDAVFRMGGYSPGADRETIFAFTLGIPVFSSMVSLGRWVEIFA